MKKQIMVTLVLAGSFFIYAEQALQPQKTIEQILNEEFKNGASATINVLKQEGYAKLAGDIEKIKREYHTRATDKGYLEIYKTTVIGFWGKKQKECEEWLKNHELWITKMREDLEKYRKSLKDSDYYSRRERLLIISKENKKINQAIDRERDIVKHWRATLEYSKRVVSGEILDEEISLRTRSDLFRAFFDESFSPYELKNEIRYLFSKSSIEQYHFSFEDDIKYWKQTLEVFEQWLLK